MKKTAYIVLCLIIGIIVCIGCKEDLGLIGLGVQPDEEFLNTDSLYPDIVAYSAIHDSLISSSVSTNMLGYVYDPVFGNTQAGIYTQFRLSATSVDFGDNAGVDSLVLTLAYAGYFGDTLNSFRLKVYELTGDLSKGETYYTKSSINHDNVSLTEDPNLYISPTPTIHQDSSASSYYLRVKLDKNFAMNKFISKSGSGEYANDAVFLNYFKGLYLEADDKTGNGCIVSLNMTHSLSGLTIYYHNDQASNLKYIFKLNDSTAHFGVVNHFDYTGATNNLTQQLNGDYTSASDVLYAQSGSGIKVILNFPSLKETFKDKKVIIHRAMLVISHQDDGLQNYSYPSALSLTYTNPNTGAGSFLPDYYFGLENDYFGGKYDATTKEYRFNITQYIQNLIDEGKYPLIDGYGDNYSLNILNLSATHLFRLMIYGTHPSSANDFDKRLRLKINYTIIDK